ncbi:CHASE3 domain-containing protein [Brevundimonas sp. FT23028]|uniref:CHASE3 domain-containing protein n=1 Tax=Brevundimonas sp. FT23028 TaxID=3393748 RepID=UPI003B58A71A
MPEPLLLSRRTATLLGVGVGLIVLAVLVGIGASLTNEFQRGNAVRAEVERSHETRAQILSVFSLLQDAETGQRGYIITGDRRFLEPYDEAEERLSAQMQRLERLYAGEPGHAAEISALKDLVGRKQSTLSEGIRLRQQRGRDPALAYVAEGAGKAAMDDIRAVIDRMVDAEAGRLDALIGRATARGVATERLVAGLFALFLALVAGTVFLVWRYIRTRRALLAEVRTVATRQAAIFDSAIDAILTLNPSGSIETMNAAASRMFGWSGPELVRRDISVLLDLENKDEVGRSFLARLGFRDGEVAGGLVRELNARRRDGGLFPVDVALSPMPLPSGLHMVAVVRDISERRRVEEMKQQFVSTVSHELRTPLTSIAGSLGLLAGGAAGAIPDKAGRLISIAHSNSQRLVRLINDILDIEKLESGQMTVDMASLDLRDIALRSIDNVQGLADDMSVAVDLDDGAAAPVRGDADRLIQVVVNLLSNAVKFSPAGSAVRVSVQPETRIARLSVSDDGPGIPDEFRARIFSKFAQADSSDTRAKGGTGLGLAIAREIAERHGGRLWFESAPGEGATFHLDLPLELAQPEAGGGAGPHLLIVEDDLDAAEVLRTMLAQDGFSADVVSTAREALGAVRGGGHAAVLVDLHLPDADGVGLIRALRSDPRTRDLPVVVVSADVARGRARGRSLEVIDWLEKPFDQARLRGAVAGILERLETRRPTVLHVDDDPDILAVTASALTGVAEVTPVPTLSRAREALKARTPDLVILDLGLPDGSGLDLLADLDDGDGNTVPVIVYSAQEMDAALGHRVEAVLVKSRTSLAGLVRTVRRLTGKGGH